MESKNNIDAREIILKHFIVELIKNTAPHQIIEEITQEVPSEKIEVSTPQIYTSENKTPLIKTQEQIKINTSEIKGIPLNMLAHVKANEPKMQTNSLSLEINNSQSPFEKINQILKDPYVLGIECPGPNKNIVVHKPEKNEASPIKLTKEEIDTIIEDISKKTRIPLLGNTFKAAIGNIIISAVISEIVGKRFIIEKKPQLRLY